MKAAAAKSEGFSPGAVPRRSAASPAAVRLGLGAALASQVRLDASQPQGGQPASSSRSTSPSDQPLMEKPQPAQVELSKVSMADTVLGPPNEVVKKQERLSACRLWALSSTNLAYGFMLADQGILLAPLEAERLFSGQASLGLAAMAVCCGMAQLCGPAAGRWSDQHHSRFGRRRPCLMMAVSYVCLLTGCISVCSEFHLSNLFMSMFLLQQLAWNVVQTVQAGLVPDIVPTEQRGAAGGVTAANTLVGALGALLGVRFLGGLSLRTHYVMTVGLLLACTLLVCLVAQEKPSNEYTEQLEEPDKLNLWRRVKGCYELDVRRHPQFAKLLLSKTLYCASVMVKGFLMFFVQDTFELHSHERDQAIVGDTAVAAEATAALAALAAMMSLDAAAAQLRAGGPLPKKDEEGDSGEDGAELSPSSFGAVRARRAAMLGALWMALLWFGPPLVGLGVHRKRQALRDAGALVEAEALASEWAPWMVAGTAVWGLGQGVYLAGDQALSYALLPDPDEASRLLGLTSVCASFGAVFGGGATGALLYVLGSGGGSKDTGFAPGGGVHATGPGYGFPGYAGMFMLAASLSGACCAVLAAVRPPGSAKTERARAVGP